MTNNLTKALDHSRAVYNNAYDYGSRMKQAGMLNALMPDTGFSQLNQFRSQSNNKQRYRQYRGWVYAAINAIASEGAGQSVKVGKLKQEEKKPKSKKSHASHRIPEQLRQKVADEELEVLPDHFLLKKLEKPNPIQHRWQFVYSFIANLCLTGWSFVVADEDSERGIDFYSLPTSWVTPVHTKGPFQQFRVADPADPAAQSDDANLLDATQVAFAYLPDPSNPFAALAPSMAQNAAITIDDNIQSSQAVFFDNMISPSAIVTIGTNPLGPANGSGGTRPRLTAAQRRQVHSAIRKLMSGVANYGNPAIVDGMIEKIERMSPAQNEIGWEKSEKTVRTRILSAFAVHPFILGEEMVGSYAQAYIVQERFFKRVNTYLGMLSTVMTYFAGPFASLDDDLLIWWEECTAKDPSMEKQVMEQARTRGDISQNEFRAWMGLPPDEDEREEVINKSMLQAVTAVAEKVAAGAMAPEQGKAILEGCGIPADLAEKIAGKAMPKPEPPPMPGMPGQPQNANLAAGQKPGAKPPNGQQKPGQQQVDPKTGKPKTDIQKAIEAFENTTLTILSKTPEDYAEEILEKSRNLISG